MNDFDGSRQRRPVCVEFVGLPGVGKTRISRQVAEFLTVWGVKTIEPSFLITSSQMGRVGRSIKKTGYVVWGALAGWSFIQTVSSLVANSRQKRMWDTLGTLFNLMYVRGLVRWHCATNEVVVLDQGFVQGLWSVYFGARSRCYDAGAKLFGRLQAPGLRFVLVHVEAELQSNRRWLAERVGRRARLESEDLLCGLREGKTVEQDMISAIEQEVDLQEAVEIIEKVLGAG